MSDKMTAVERVAQYERAMFRTAAPTVDGALVGAPTRAVSRKDAIRIAEEHADAAVKEVTRERDAARAALKLALDGVHCACIVFEAACPSCVGRRVLRAADGGEGRS